MKNIFAACFILTGVFTAFLSAQKADSMFVVPGSVKEEPSELVGRLDANGQKASGLIIYSDLKGLAYDSYNGPVGDVDRSKPGRDFLFLSADERVVQIFSTGYAPLKIFLSELGIRLKKGQSWSLQITGNKKKLFGNGLLSVRVEPTNAGFQYELGKDNWVIKNPPFDTLALPSNIYPVKISKEFYKTVEDTIEIKNNERLSKSYSLERMKGFLIIKSKDENNQELAGATIFLNGQRNVEKTPFSKRVNADDYDIRIELDGYLVDSATVKLRDEEHPESKEFVLRKIGIVTFKGTPNATVSFTNDLGQEKLLGAVPENGAFATQMRPDMYDLVFRLGR